MEGAHFRTHDGPIRCPHVKVATAAARPRTCGRVRHDGLGVRHTVILWRAQISRPGFATATFRKQPLTGLLSYQRASKALGGDLQQASDGVIAAAWEDGKT